MTQTPPFILEYHGYIRLTDKKSGQQTLYRMDTLERMSTSILGGTTINTNVDTIDVTETLEEIAQAVLTIHKQNKNASP